jgi:hypothetical protein
MKNILLFLSVIFLSNELLAQGLGLNLGPSLMNQRINSGKKQFGNFFHISLFYEGYLSEKSNLGIECGLQQNGSAIRMNNQFIDLNQNGAVDNGEIIDYTQKFAFNNLTLAIYFKNKFIIENFALQPFYKIQIHGKYLFSDDMGGYAYQYKSTTYNYDYRKKLTYGVGFAGGAIYPLKKIDLFFELKYIQDLSDQIFRPPVRVSIGNNNQGVNYIDLQEEQIRNYGIMLGIGFVYKFGEPEEE